MQIDLENLVPITEANQNFSKVARLVDENGMAPFPIYRLDGARKEEFFDWITDKPAPPSLKASKLP